MQIKSKKNLLSIKKFSTLDEILKYGTWDDESTLNIFELYAHSELFSKMVKIDTICDDKKLIPSHLTLLNVFLALNPLLLVSIKEKLWEHCEFLFYMADYGAELEGKTNYEFFNIFTLDDAYEKANLVLVRIETEENIFEVHFYPEWEEEHGFVVEIVQGELVFEPYADDIYKEFETYRKNVERRTI